MYITNEFLLIPSIVIGWDDENVFFIEAGWLNLFLGVDFG